VVRGKFRIYLGAAPGVGKTYAMLEEGRRRSGRGTDVVVGLVETHGRARTRAALGDLEVIPCRTITHRGASFTEMDTDAVIARAPQVALVDELAHSNVTGSANEKRWQDIERLLDAGIDVISTVNIQHLESVNDVVEHITGLPQRETVPDEVVRRADQVELVDMTPEALRRRLAHGNIYPPERVDAALGKYFRVGNLTALRELALLWVADKVDEQLARYRTEHHIDAAWEARERVVVALSGGGEGDTVLRRAARIAARTRADLLAVHVNRTDGLTRADPAHLSRQRTLAEHLGGSYHQVVGDDIATALLEFARGANATQLVLGASRRNRLEQLLDRGVGAETTARSGSIDVHMVNHEQTSQGRGRRPGPVLTLRRRGIGLVMAVVGMPLITAVLAVSRTRLSLAGETLVFLLGVVAVSLVGGIYPALIATVLGLLLLSYYFAPPFHSMAVTDSRNALALVVYLTVAATVSWVIDIAARRTREAAAASADAGVLTALSRNVLRGEDSPDAILALLRHTYGLEAAALLERPPDMPVTPARAREPERWRVVAHSGDAPPTSPDDADTTIAVGEDVVLALRGRLLTSTDRQVLEAFAAQAVIALQRQRLRDEAEKVRPLAEADRLRTALLNTVSHDLRTPLASAKAAIDSLHNPGLTWSATDRGELVDIAAESIDRLNRLVANLLDMSRLQADALGMVLAPVAVDEIVDTVLGHVGPAAAEVTVRVAPELPDVLADAVLLERVLDNVIRNALRYAPPERGILVSVDGLGDTVEIRVADHGPGVPAAERERIFQPFQRLNDSDNHTGVGLGLALARGLVEAMGGAIAPADTPGGGLTMVMSLPRASSEAGVNEP
jgi:two-component system sensor histidine kinase KdpD